MSTSNVPDPLEALDAFFKTNPNLRDERAAREWWLGLTEEQRESQPILLQDALNHVCGLDEDEDEDYPEGYDEHLRAEEIDRGVPAPGILDGDEYDA